MDRNIKIVSTHDLFPIIEELLAIDRQAIFTIKGTSMLPFIGDNRDSVVLEKRNFNNLKKGDIILFQYDNGKYILHRIYNTSKEGYQTIGDGCIFFDEWIRYDQVKGVVTKIVRKGKEINCNSIKWKIISSLWMRLLPIRKYLLRAYFKLGKIKRKLLNILRGEANEFYKKSN